ncbi:FxsA family protein [Pseudoponticoccus marisrubri]|uniref:Exlusion protein FxsA n=1 Tax=Pseudoponticoccus marisrubri TaxID=1685382 RepID=A0A0W7WGB3_9RHOB|nr:FxsA family protein [Pseudoponticoccus marisrubri]KUF09633.1 exlusion protein FxsA [Pseudoponticoccus marisrubri]
MWLLAAFILVPLIEIGLFIQVGGWLGLWPTLAIVVLTAIIGTWLVRAQGRMALDDLRNSFERMSNPGEPLAHGAMILFSGALLLTPGFFTDAVGFALLAPPVRRAVMVWVRKRVKVQEFRMGPQQPGPGQDPRRTPPGRPQRPGQGDVIDGEFTEVPPGKSPNHPGSGWTKH